MKYNKHIFKILISRELFIYVLSLFIVFAHEWFISVFKKYLNIFKIIYVLKVNVTPNEIILLKMLKHVFN